MYLFAHLSQLVDVRVESFDLFLAHLQLVLDVVLGFLLLLPLVIAQGNPA